MSLHNNMVEYWYEWHKETRGDEPTKFSGADARAIKEIRQRLKIVVERKRGLVDDQTILNTFKFILERLKQLKEIERKAMFLYESTLPTINSHLDSLLAIIRKHGVTTESVIDKNRREAREQILRSSL